MRKLTYSLLLIVPLSFFAYEGMAQEAKLSLPHFFDQQQSPANRLKAIEKTSVLIDPVHINEAIQMVKDPGEIAALRVAAIKRIVVELSSNDALSDFVLLAIPNEDESVLFRQAALESLQAILFGSPAIDYRVADYQDAIRKVLRDPNVQLRETAARMLYAMDDTYTADRLMEGLKEPDKALIHHEKAIRMLAFKAPEGFHQATLAILKQSDQTVVQIEAIKALKKYKPARATLATILQNKTNNITVRRTAAASLHQQDNPEFGQQIRPIIMDNKDDVHLRVFCVGALAYHPLEYINPDPSYVATLQKIAGDHQTQQLKMKARMVLKKIEVSW